MKERVVDGEVFYYTPCGKKQRSLPEVERVRKTPKLLSDVGGIQSTSTPVIATTHCFFRSLLYIDLKVAEKNKSVQKINFAKSCMATL